MGKFLGAIITTLVGVALLFVPGGQTIGVGLIASGLGQFVTALLTPGAPKPETVDAPIKTSRPPRVSAYGRSRLYGAYALYETAPNGSAVDVYAVHEGERDAIEGYYLNDETVTLTGTTVNEGTDGRYRDGAVSIYTTDGTSPGAGFPALVSLLGASIWTNDHRGDGLVALALTAKSVKAKHFQETYPSSQVPAPSLVGRWQKCPDPAAVDPLDDSAWTWTENPVRQLLHYKMVREGPRPSLDEDNAGYAAALASLRLEWWNRKIAPTLAYWVAAAAVCDEAVALKGVQTSLTADANDGSTTISVGAVTGLAIGMQIAITEQTNSSHTETRTVTGISGLDVSFSGGLDYDHSDGSAVTWASNPANPAHEARYRSLVSHKHTDKHEGVVANFMATFDGWICPRNDGALVVFAGKYYAPDPVDDLIGPDEIVAYTWNGGAVDDDTAINEIVCSYVSAEHDYNSVECDAWRDETDIANRGQILSDGQEIAVPSNGQARRLAKRKIQKLLAVHRGTITTNLAGRHARGKRFVYLKIEEAGTTFYEGPAEITSLSRAVQGGVTFDWVAADPNVDAWNPAAEEGDPAAVGNRVAPAALVAPSISAYSVAFDSTGARLQLTVDSPDRDDLTWYVHWRVQGESVWGPDEESTDTDPGTAVALSTSYVPSDDDIEVQVAYQTGDGRFSDWSATETISTDTSALAPAPATDLDAADGTGESGITWRNPNSSNFGFVRLYRATTTNFGDAVQVGSDMPGGLGAVMAYTDTGLSAGTYNYWVRSYSTGGIAASPTGPDEAVVS